MRALVSRALIVVLALGLGCDSFSGEGAPPPDETCVLDDDVSRVDGDPAHPACVLAP
jgi:hypothetical protein